MRLLELHQRFDLERFMTECSPWLEVIRGSPEPAYRGIKELNDDFEIYSVPNTRSPIDMPPDVHKALNDFFESKFGWRARDNGLFVTGSDSDAKQYGTIYAAFPIGKFKTLWTSDTSDLFSKWGIWKHNNRKNPEPTRFIEMISEQFTWHFNEHVKEGLAKEVEMIIGAEDFYLIKIKSDLWNHIVLPHLQKEGILK